LPSFIRNVRVTVASRLTSTSTDSTGARFNNFGSETVIEGLRVSFEIVKDLKPQGNKATIRIYNLSKGTRKLFAQKPIRVTLEAGYDGEYSKIYEGDLITGKSKEEAPEWITTLQLGTGHDKDKHARHNKGYKINANPREVIKGIVGAMGDAMPKNLDDFKQTFSSGFTLKGSAAESLTKLLKVEGMGWSRQDGRLQFLKDGQGTTASAVVVSVKTGMIGSPELTSPDKKGQPAVLKLRTILDSEKTPGRILKVESRDTNGTYIATKVTMVGDNYGTPWYSDVEAIHI